MTYIWKEWLEQTRSKGLWLALGMLVLLSLAILLQSRAFPADQGYEVFLLSLYEMNVYLIPLLSLFLAAFSMMQEKEYKTALILLTRRESLRTFIFKKSLAIQAITLGLVVLWYLILALPAKLYLEFHPAAFFAFLLATGVLLVIGNQLGIFLGSLCTSRMQLMGACIFTWFLFLFLLDLAFLYFLPQVKYDNVQLFSYFYFLDPLHTLHFYLEGSLGLFPIDHMSRLMQKMVQLRPWQYLMLDVLIWLPLSFELSVRLYRGGDRG